MKEETAAKKTIMCYVCKEYKAKATCNRCDRPICLNCRRYEYGYKHKNRLCQPCYAPPAANNNNECSIL